MVVPVAGQPLSGGLVVVVGVVVVVVGSVVVVGGVVVGVVVVGGVVVGVDVITVVTSVVVGPVGYVPPSHSGTLTGKSQLSQTGLK